MGPTARNVDLLNLPLATVDIAEAQKTPEKMAPVVGKALENEGFLYLVNIPGFKTDELLEAAKWMFALPLDTKMAIAKNVFKPGNANAYRGYFPVIPGGHSHKECFETGNFGDFDPSQLKNQKLIDGRPLMRDFTQEGNSWPKTGDEYDEKFKATMEKYYNLYHKTAAQVLQLVSLGLGLAADQLDCMYRPNTLSTFRLLHYPSRVNFPPGEIPAEARDGATLITTGEHSDTTFITLLATFDNWGLQMLQKGTWVDIPPIKDSLVMNIGALMADKSKGKLKATMHRVIDLGQERFSAPFFYEPDFDANVSKTYDDEDIPDFGEFHKYGPWMANRTKQFKEYATTDFGIVD